MSGLDKYKNKAEEIKPIQIKENKDSFMEEMNTLLAKYEAEKQKQVVKSEPLQPTVQNKEHKIQFAKPTEETVTAQNDNTVFTKADRKKLIAERLASIKKTGGRLRRSEKKDIQNQEYDKTNHTRAIIIGLAVAGLIFIAMIRPYLPNDAMYAIILIMGMMLFFPCGIIAGWIFLDPVMRCKILRKTSKRNYGIVGFVGKGMKAVLKIKNFDDGIIWREKAAWVITRDKLVQITKDGNALTDNEKVITPDSVITLVDTVPMIFVDLDSMEPLQLHPEGREAVYPLEIGATLKAWEDNQRAKMMALHKVGDILLYVAIICAAGAIVIGFLNLNKIESMAKEITEMHSMLYNMSQLH